MDLNRLLGGRHTTDVAKNSLNDFPAIVTCESNLLKPTGPEIVRYKCHSLNGTVDQSGFCHTKKRGFQP